eukprot:403362072
MRTNFRAAVLFSLLSTVFVTSQYTRPENRPIYQRKFNKPYNHVIESEQFDIKELDTAQGIKKVLVSTGKFSLTKVSSDLDITHQFSWVEVGNQNVTYSENVYDFADGTVTAFDSTKNTCEQYPIPEIYQKSERENVDEENDPFNSTSTYYGLKKVNWNSSDTDFYYIFGTNLAQQYYSERTGLQRYSAIYLSYQDPQVYDYKDSIKEAYFTEEDFVITQCEGKFHNNTSKVEYLE